MTSPHRKRRGAQTQQAVADYLKAHGWPYAESAGAGRPGEDVTNVPGLAVEVKARRDLSLPAWLRQAAKSKGLPIVVHRPDGMGLGSLEDWPATMRFADLVQLLRDAGYGAGAYGDSEETAC
ncbi:MAG: hypothetical protein ACRDT8_00110 [Micromonosporaceae bacterium]